MFTAAVGHSEDLDAGSAIEEVLSECHAAPGGTTPTAGLLFAAIDFDHQVLLDEINRQFPGTALIGCTTDGDRSKGTERTSPPAIRPQRSSAAAGGITTYRDVLTTTRGDGKVGPHQ